MNDNGEERTDILVLVDDEGNEHDFALVDRFQVDLQEYAILVPVLYFEDAEDEDYVDFEDEAYIFRIEKGISEQNNISENLYDHLQGGTVVTEDTIGSISPGSGGGKNHTDEQEYLVEVEDEEEWGRVAALWEERVKTSEYNNDEDLS